MRRSILIAALGIAACKPDLGPPGSLVQGPRILAIRATPAEVPPLNQDAGVVYDVLAVTPDGTITDPQTNWTYCVAPTPPSDNNLVSPRCLGANAQLVQIAQDGSDGVAEVPSNACSLFGPFPPPTTDAGTGRPPDADGTGGYYQPVRLDLSLGDGGLTSFGEERIACGLPNVTIDVANGFKAYTLNLNPVLSGVTASVNGGDTLALAAPDAGPGPTIPAGATVAFAASWPADSVETFPVLDPVTRTLVTQRENFISSWFVTGGAMALDEVEVPGTDTSSTMASNTWTAPATPGPVHLWVVLRDSRGGVDFAEFLVTVQ